MRSILVYADHGPAMPARLATALALARMTRGHLTVMVDTAIACYTPVDPMGGSYIAADAIRETMARDDAYADEIEARLALGDVPHDVRRGEDDPVHALTAAARLCDVVVLSRNCDFAGALALSTRCPILLVPASDDALAAKEDSIQDGRGAMRLPFGLACIAWDGSEEAAAALRASIPLLTTKVRVLTVQDKPGDARSNEALGYLSCHGIDAKFVAVERVGSTAESLAAATARLQADLLVMGAYGRSRMREFLFGGVTRHFLGTNAGPALFLAH